MKGANCIIARPAPKNPAADFSCGSISPTIPRSSFICYQDSIMPNLRCLMLLFASYAAHADESAVVATDVLRTHNQLRSVVNAPPLRYSHPLAKSAQAWADYLNRTRACQAEYSSVTLGENVYLAQSAASMTDVINAWGAAQTDYRQHRCRGGQVCGSYTQIIWKTTTRVGCAVSRCSSGDQIWVCHYFPAGNWAGQYPY